MNNIRLTVTVKRPSVALIVVPPKGQQAPHNTTRPSLTTINSILPVASLYTKQAARYHMSSTFQTTGTSYLLPPATAQFFILNLFNLIS